MARERMITRTIDLTIGEAMCVDVPSQSIKNIEFRVWGMYTDTTKLLEAVKEDYETDIFKVVMVNDYQVGGVLMGMPERDFIVFAKVLPLSTTANNPTDGNITE